MFNLDNMVSIIQLIMLLLCVFGYSTLLHSKFKVKINFSGICSVAFISIVLILAGILNMLLPVSIVLYISGIFLFIINLFMGELSFKKYKLYYILTILSVVVYSILLFGSEVFSEGGFNHWGLVVRLIQTTNRIPRFDDTVLVYKDYPLGVSLFSYFGSLMVKYKESLYIQSYVVVFVMAMGSMISFVDKNTFVDEELEKMLGDNGNRPKESRSNEKEIKKRLEKISTAIEDVSQKPGIEDRITSDGVKKVVFLSLSVIYFIGIVVFSELFNTRIYTMYIDSILAISGVSLMFLVYSYRDDMENIVIPYVLISCFVVNISHSGLFFVLFSSVYMMYHIFTSGNINTRTFVCLLIPFFAKFAWERHCIYVYNTLENTRFSFSFSNFSKELAAKGDNNVANILNAFIGKNLSDEFWYILVIFVVLSAIWFLIRRKDISFDFFKTCIFMFFITLFYQVCLAMMYIYSMPLSEAQKLMGYDRYFNVIKLFVILYFIAFLYRNIRDIVFPINEAIIVLGLFIAVINFNMLGEFLTPAVDFYRSNGIYQFKKSSISNMEDVDYMSPEDTMNKKVVIFDNIGHSYSSYIVYRYILLTPSIDIKKSWDENKTDTSKYDVVLKNLK